MNREIYESALVTIINETWSDAARAASAAARRARGSRAGWERLGRTPPDWRKAMDAAYKKAGGKTDKIPFSAAHVRSGGLADTVGKERSPGNQNMFLARRGFFYTHGGSGERLGAQIKAKFPKARIYSTDTVWKPFRGGASTANQSHFSARFSHPRRYRPSK